MPFLGEAEEAPFGDSLRFTVAVSADVETGFAFAANPWYLVV